MALELTSQQAAAVTDRGGNLLVSAAAGSGTTRVLVERLMDYVKSGEDIDRFLIITFTNASAAELRDRIARAVSELLAQNPADRHLRRNATLVYKAPISTIDAFCLDFLRECGPAAGLDPDFRLCDEAEGKALGQQAMETVLERRYQNIGNDPAFAALVDALAGDRDDQTLEEVVSDVHRRVQSHPEPLRWLVERRGDFDLPADAQPEGTVWGRLLLEDGQTLAAYWAETLENLTDEMAFDDVVGANYGPTLTATANHLRALERALGEGWDACRALFPVTFPRAGGKRGGDSVLKERVKALRDLCKKQITQLGERFDVSAADAMDDLRAVAPAMTALLDVTAEYDRELTELKRRRHLIDFADGEHLTARLLTREDGQPSALAAEWSRRYREIMVDEYQDTNAVQNVIFDALSTGDNLFMVGDVKQSIYRFRLADPTIFLRKYGQYADASVAEPGEGRTVLLSRNFRSRPEVLEGTNFIFRNVMTEPVGEMDYTGDEALIPGREDLPPDGRYCVELDCVDLSDPDGEEEEEKLDKDLAEARAAAARIAELLREGLPIGDRPVTPEDIVILLRSPGPVLADYTLALDEQGIPWQAEDGGEFFGTTEISVALSLLQVIDNPRQDVPLLSVLRSPLFDFTPDRLAELRAGAEGTVYDCVRAGAERGEEDCTGFFALLADLRALAAEESSHRLLWEVYRRTDLLAVFSAMPDGARRRANLLALYDSARRFESAGHKGLFGFLTHLTRMVESDLAMPVPSAAGRGVRILSIHKSKGLEFPVVFLCGLERQFNEADSRSTILFHDVLGLGPKRTDRARMIRYTTIARDAVALRLRQQLRAEELRLLYVAMTRAEHKLFLFTAVNGGRGENLNTLAMQAQCPPPPRLMAQARSMAAWVLIPALCRPDSGPLWAALDADCPAPPENLGPKWDMRLLPGTDYRNAPAPTAETAAETPDAPDAGAAEELRTRFSWTYPHAAEVDMPSKLTATQLKGREKDAEVSESAEELRPQRPRRALRRPIFGEERPLTPTERGTALHLAMQYLDYSKTDTEAAIREEVARLTAGQFITPAQGAAVDTAAIRALFASPLGGKLRNAPQVEREFKFSMLVPAADYFPECEPGEELLLQGVVDCWFREEDGSITVVDFKTDRVTEHTVEERAAGYRPQLEAYTRALGEVMGAPVTQRVLWFFAVDREISW